MEIEYMNQQEQITIRDAKIINQNYSVNWLAPVYHKDILVCMKSSWMSYSRFSESLRRHLNESEYQDDEIYWIKVTGKTSVTVLTNRIRSPIDVILLPMTENKIYIPQSEEMCRSIQKTIKGVVKYIKKEISSWIPSININEEIILQNSSLSLPGDTVIAEYLVGNLRYPVTAGMLGQKIEIQHPRNVDCRVCIAKEFGSKYNLIRSEE